MNNNKSAGITTPEGLFILSMVEVKWGALKRAVIQLIPEMMRPARFIPRYELAIFRGPPAQAYEPVSVKVREWISSALASPDFTLSSKEMTSSTPTKRWRFVGGTKLQRCSKVLAWTGFRFSANRTTHREKPGSRSQLRTTFI